MNRYLIYILILVSLLACGPQAPDIKYSNKEYLKSLLSEDQKFYNEDSLKAILAAQSHDTARADLLLKLARSYQFKAPDTSLYYANKVLKLSRKASYTKGILNGLRAEDEALRSLANFPEALKSQFELLRLSEEIENIDFQTTAIGFIGINYYDMHQFDHALERLKKAVAMSKPIHHELTKGREAFFNVLLARVYTEINRTDSAFYYLMEAKKINANSIRLQFSLLRTYCLGDAHLRADNKDSAKFYYKLALKLGQADPIAVPGHISYTSSKLAEIYDVQNQIDSSFYFARNAYRIAKSRSMNSRILLASSLLSKLHRKKGRLDSALHYQDISNLLKDSIYGEDKLRKQQVLLLEEQQRTEKIQRAEERRALEVEQAQERFQNNLLIIGLLTVTTIILVASILLFRSNRTKQKTNLVLQQALSELKATQSQLIQSEKMASLGELTAGIAHEIQNPLNFVNNFSELNKELIDELNLNAREGKIDAVQKLASDIKENEEKIEHHGKRADAIVKSMLQHSRASSGKKEQTDINALCDEYSRLAYHGYRAKDKSFNAKLEIDFDQSLLSIHAIPQDIGRVILNLLNNAFYAVVEKEKTSQPGYAPTVKISTKKFGDRIEIRVEDNGNGVPGVVREKIFQPFFTTKPSGQGTGLGLSLAYDIITKAHGGEMKVESEEGKGCEFIILLPITRNA